MARTLYFHIGMGRCGSTAIQEFVAKNREILEQAGIALPTPAELGSPLRHSGNATGLAQVLRNRAPDAPDVVATIERAQSCLRALATPNCLLSSEFFYALPVEHFASLKQAFNTAGFHVVAICYIREQREWLASYYGQAVKARKWTETLENYMRDNFRVDTLNYLKQFRPLRDVFGADNLIIRIFERQRMTGGDVRQDFCEILGLSTNGMIFEAGAANASGNLLQIELMRAMNGAPRRRHFKFRNRDFLRTTSDLFRSGKMTSPDNLYRLVQPKVMNNIGNYFKLENENFRAEFFPSLKSPLFSDRIPEKYRMVGTDDRVAAYTAVLLNEYVNHVLRRKSRTKKNKKGQKGPTRSAPSEKSRSTS